MPMYSIGDSMPMHVEKQVLDWSKEMMGFPATASGLLISGASLANITALVVARHHANRDIKTKGLQARARSAHDIRFITKPIIVY